MRHEGLYGVIIIDTSLNKMKTSIKDALMQQTQQRLDQILSGVENNQERADEFFNSGTLDLMNKIYKVYFITFLITVFSCRNVAKESRRRSSDFTAADSGNEYSARCWGKVKC